MKWLILKTLLVLPALAQNQPQWDSSSTQVIQEILPTKQESAWLSIPWRTNLWQARQEAAQANKPIYLWEMDGHPLGCT